MSSLYQQEEHVEEETYLRMYAESGAGEIELVANWEIILGQLELYTLIPHVLSIYMYHAERHAPLKTSFRNIPKVETA